MTTHISKTSNESLNKKNKLKSVYLDQNKLTPDPTFGRKTEHISGNKYQKYIYPYQVVDAFPFYSQLEKWKQDLKMFTSPAPLKLNLKENQFNLFLDFGTELFGNLELVINTVSRANLIIRFGESIPEASGLVPVTHPSPAQCRHISGRGSRSLSFAKKGFRYVNLMFTDLKEKIEFKKIAVRGEFTFQKARGDFVCSDDRFQRVWQSSAYTARLCTRQQEIWDGIKRGQSSWYGDNRITKQTIDDVFLAPEVSEHLLLSLATEEWPTGIPVYAFDAIAMLEQHILIYGLQRESIGEIYARIKKLLNWIAQTQTSENGFITYTDCDYFHDIGFLDWSKIPIGGKFEELSWLQIKYIEGLKTAARIGQWLGDETAAEKWLQRATEIEKIVQNKFWKKGTGFIHTLNKVYQETDQHSGENSIVYKNNQHYKQTYEKNVALGPSKPSRQANALAIFANLCTPEMKKIILHNVFNNTEIPPIITPYFAYYEQFARAECGDPDGALLNFSNYIGQMLEDEDSATVWEMYDPQVKDLRKYFTTQDINHQWPVSLCHGWGSGIVPLTRRYLLGIIPRSPGYKKIFLNPRTDFDWTFSATIPTIHGPIKITREQEGGKIKYSIPKEVEITNHKGNDQLILEKR